MSLKAVSARLLFGAALAVLATQVLAARPVDAG